MNHQQPLVSIGLPVYNGADSIKIALKSLLNQTYHNFELIISDNCSTDDTGVICEDYAKRDSRIRYFRQPVNRGAIFNFNFVLKKAKGDYFMWAADDDRWHIDFIKHLLAAIIKSNSVLAVPNYQLNDHGVKTKVTLNNKIGLSRKDLIIDFLNNVSRDNTIFIYGLMKTKMIKSIKGYHQDIRPYYHASDFVTIIKILLNGKVINVSKTLFYKEITVLYFKKYQLISKGEINRQLSKAIQRYLFDPVYNTLDLYYSIKATKNSTLTSSNKNEIYFQLSKYYLFRIIYYFVSLIKGSILLTGGFLKNDTNYK